MMSGLLRRGLHSLRGFIAVLLLLAGALPSASSNRPPRCASGSLITALDLKIVPPEGGQARRLRDVNAIPAGWRILYAPGYLAGNDPEDAKISVVMAPAEPGRTIEISDPFRANEPGEWKAPFRIGVLGVVFGPQGLDRKKVRNMVAEDADLISQLAEYAEKSTQTENLIQALAAYEKQPNSGQNLEAALTGFAGAWSLPMSRLDASAPLDQQAALLIRTLNPAFSSLDPLSQQSGRRFQQSAGLAASVAGLFWGPTVGVAAGGTALFLNLRNMMFPGTDFRSTFAQAGSENVALCAARETQKPRTRLAYLWAVKVPNIEAPKLELARDAHLAAGLRSEVALRPAEFEGRFLLRARDWRVTPVGGGEDIPVRVLPASAAGKLSSIQLDLAAAEVPPGEYRLAGRWDWTDFQVDGAIHVYRLSPLTQACPPPETTDRLIAGVGAGQLEIKGADFQFVRKATLRRQGEPSAKATGLELLSPEDLVPGPRPVLRIAVDTSSLSPGAYTLALEQQGGLVTDIPVRVLPPHPVLDGLPLRVNLGEPQQLLTLRGRGLDRIEVASAEKAELQLLAGNATKRQVRVRLLDPALKGDSIGLRLKVEGVHAELPVDHALFVAGPRPRITAVTVSAPPEASVELREGELPAGVPRTFAVRATGLDGTTRLQAGCDDPSRTLAPVSLRRGEQRNGAEMQQTGPETLFLSLEPGMIGPPGCRLRLLVETDGEGTSDPAALGTVVRLPRIEEFEFTDEQTAAGLYIAVLEGYDLDAIAQTGWNGQEGHPVQALPSPLPGQAPRQSLRIALPWPAPSPRAPLYVFLHEETTGRLTRARL